MFTTSHPLYLTLYPLYLCHLIACIDDITPTEFLRSHPVYMTTSYPLYMTSQRLNVCHHTHSFNNITPFVCRTSHPLYVYHLMHYTQCQVHSFRIHTIVVITLHPLHSHNTTHPIYHITNMAIHTLYLPSDPLYLTLHPEYLSPHNHSKYDL